MLGDDDDDDEDDDDNDPTVANKFPLLLGDSSHEVRMYMTKAVQWWVTNLCMDEHGWILPSRILG